MTVNHQVVILRSNPVSPDPRVEKTARALSTSGWRVTIIGWDRSACLPMNEEHDAAFIHRIPIRSSYADGLRNLVPLALWQVRLLWWLLLHRCSYGHIHACDFDTILPAFLMRLLSGKRVIYDVFDFYADAHDSLPAGFRRLIRRTDLWLISRVDAVILVDDSRRKQLQDSTPKRIEVIYNSPEDVFDELELQATGINRESGDNPLLRIAFVGVLSVTRGILEMLRVLERHPDWTMELAGFGGDDAQPIIAKAQCLPNVTFHGRVLYDQALAISARADVLFATYDPMVPNHKYSSANKLFEAMMLGKPIIVACNTGMDDLVRKHGTGFVVSYGDVGELELACAQIASWDSSTRTRFAQHTRDVYHHLFDQKLMQERLRRLYASLV
jgi:glycosyltransferase involved in cell wall biosynthesis